jgi:hypothetical protein
MQTEQRASRQRVLAVTFLIALMMPTVAVTDASAGHAIAAESQVAWRAHLAKVADAVDKADMPGAVLHWRDAYAAALRSRHWEGLVAVGDAYRRLGDRGGFKEVAAAKARTIYLAALFRARQEASLDGVLRAAQAFADLGDAVVVAQCLKLARPLAAETRDARADQRLHVFAARWEARRLEIEHRNELGRGESVQ